MDLHSLDRKLNAFTTTVKYNPDHRQELISFYESLPIVSEVARRSLNTLLHDIGSIPNMDPVNGLVVEDLLEEIRFSYNASVLNTLTQQLEEMQTGMCPAGRTIRLYSVLFALYSI